MPAQSTIFSQQQLVDAAKAPVLAFNNKDWDAARASMSSDFDYDEVATNRKAQGVDQVLSMWQGWAQAFPDAKGIIHNTLVSGNSVVLEATWKGTHKGPFQTPKGPVAATGKPIAIRACMIFEIAGEKARSQRHYFDMVTLFQQLGVAT